MRPDVKVQQSATCTCCGDDRESWREGDREMGRLRETVRKIDREEEGRVEEK